MVVPSLAMRFELGDIMGRADRFVVHATWGSFRAYSWFDAYHAAMAARP